ncbi:MAG: hypothetical protein RIE32_01355 [Phycisphaerales bacterium]
MRTCTTLGPAAIGLLAALATPLHAQVHQTAFTTDDDETEGWRATDAGIGVNADAVVVTSNMSVSLFARTGGSPLATFQVGDTSNFPFKKFDATYGRLFDPQVDYDPIDNRLWMIYSEDNTRDPSSAGGGSMARIHMAVSRLENGTIDDFSSDHWFYFTGNASASPPTVRDGEPFDLRSTALLPYQGEPGHTGYIRLADRPTLAFDERAVIIASWGAFGFPDNANTLTIIPRTHDGATKSILAGDRPDESDITFVRFDGDELEEDRSTYYMSVQEPFEQFENKTFFINDPDDISGVSTGIRLCGLYWDEELEPDPDWQVRQKTVGASLDILLGDAADHYHISGPNPRTPDSGWSPPVPEGHIHTAVLVRDANNDPRIFAAHAVNPDDDGTPVDQLVVQWYVIDPDLTNFETTSWNPTFDAVGRIDHGDTTGDHYHPVIGVTEQGVAYIEYTYSDANTWPQVRRVTLNSTYDGIVPNSEVIVKTGPSYAYTGSANAWADFAEMQADPVTGCSFWSVHTLVHDVADGPTVLDRRDVWLFQSVFNCGNSNLNFDEGTDLYDMAMFNDLFNAGARRVDMNTDGTTDATDAILYHDAYDAATGP